MLGAQLIYQRDNFTFDINNILENVTEPIIMTRLDKYVARKGTIKIGHTIFSFRNVLTMYTTGKNKLYGK
jgi:hypothetical protein